MKWHVNYVGLTGGSRYFGSELSQFTADYQTKQEALKKARNLRRQVSKGAKRWDYVEVTES